MSPAKLLKGGTRIKSGYDGKKGRQAKSAPMRLDLDMTVCGSGGKPHIVSIRELTSPGVEAASGCF
jgi:hypothetical protein